MDSADLHRLDEKLDRLEAALVAEYERCGRTQAQPFGQRIAIREQRRADLLGKLHLLARDLYADGSAKEWCLVSEHHDAVRIRIIALRHLLARDIPRPYADEALHEPPCRPAPPTPLPRAQTPANTRRLLHLHRLMAEDRLDLLVATERPPHLPGAPVPGGAAHFSGRDLAEAHHAPRDHRESEPIARTPDELRAKLSRREHQRRR
jgi:hypothetical protein